MKNALTTNYTNDTDAGKTYRVSFMNLAAKSFFAFLTLAFLATATVLRAQREKLPPADLEYVEKNWPEAKKTNSGIRYIILREGKGDTPKPGDKVNVLYVGRLMDGKVFDQNDSRDHPFEFRVRRQMVIEGWDQVLQLMQRGEKRLVIIPPELAYGTRGQPPKIPRSATLVFEIELLDFKRD
jgi:FKBP-type peptidyl-prolyl cis-trans isomerase